MRTTHATVCGTFAIPTLFASFRSEVFAFISIVFSDFVFIMCRCVFFLCPLLFNSHSWLLCAPQQHWKGSSAVNCHVRHIHSHLFSSFTSEAANTNAHAVYFPHLLLHCLRWVFAAGHIFYDLLIFDSCGTLVAYSVPFHDWWRLGYWLIYLHRCK